MADSSLTPGPWRESWVELGPGRAVHVLEAGQGPTLVYFPGNACSAQDVDLLRPALACSHRLIALDLPGREPTRWPDEPFDFLADLPGVVDRVLAALKAGPHIALGHSMGGMFALHHARRHPRSVLALVLMEGFVSLQTHYRVASQGGQRLVRAPDAVPSAFAARMEANRAWLAAHSVFAQSFWASQQAHDARPWISTLIQPVLFILGSLGQPMPASPASMSSSATDAWRNWLDMEGLKDLEVCVVPQTGHWMMLDDAPRVAAALVEFVLRKAAISSAIAGAG